MTKKKKSTKKSLVRSSPKKKPKLLKALWAALGIDPIDMKEGIIILPRPKGEDNQIFLTSNEKDVEELKKWARRLADLQKRKVKVVKFSNREELEEFG